MDYKNNSISHVNLDDYIHNGPLCVTSITPSTMTLPMPIHGGTFTAHPDIFQESNTNRNKMVSSQDVNPALAEMINRL